MPLAWISVGALAAICGRARPIMKSAAASKRQEHDQSRLPKRLRVSRRHFADDGSVLEYSTAATRPPATKPEGHDGEQEEQQQGSWG